MTQPLAAPAPKPAWRLVHTKPRQERIAQDNLRRQGYETYLPRFGRRTQAGIAVQVLFPRYLFIRLADTVDNWRPIQSTVGVTRLVHFGAVVPQVPDSLVTSLRAAEDPAGLLPTPDKALQPGDEVDFLDPSFRQYEAIFHCAKDDDRIVILMNIVGVKTPMTVPATAIKPRFP